VRAGAGTFGLESLLGWHLGVAGRLIRTQADAGLADFGVGAQGLGVLLRLADEDGLTQAELARRQRVEAPTMCRMIDRLEREGLLERRPRPGDRRAALVVVTDRGREVAAEGLAVVEGLERRAFAALDAGERATLADLLARVAAALGGPEPSP
jgi:MarR family transcriptional regulator, transcriptional regulator for hemolysin